MAFANYKSVLPQTGENLETLINYTIKFFSRKENRTENSIINLFMPKILEESRMYQGGQTLNLNMFAEKIDDDQISFLEKIFSQVTTLSINTTIFKDEEIFFFIDKFKLATELKISLNGDDKYVFPPTLMKFSSIKINCMNKNVWLNPVHQILKHNTENLIRFSLYNSYLSADTIEILYSQELERLTLENLILFCPEDGNRLLELIRHKKSLKKIKIIYSKQVSFQNAFEQFANTILDNFQKNFENIENLNITLNQDKPNKVFNLENLKNLRKLTIHFTTEKSFNNIDCLIDELNELRKKNVLNIPIIQFVEYYSGVIAFMTSQKAIELQFKSNGYATKIIEKSHKYVKIIQLKL